MGGSTVAGLVQDDEGMHWFCFVALDSMTCHHNSYFVDFVDGGEGVRLVHYSRIDSRQVNQTISCGCMSLRHDERHA